MSRARPRGNLIPLAWAAQIIDEQRADGQSSRSWVYRVARPFTVRIGSRKFVRRRELAAVFGEDVAEIIQNA